MNVIDAMVLLLLAMGDLWLIVFLRSRRSHYLRIDAMTHSLQDYIRSQLPVPAMAAPQGRLLKRAS